MCNQLTNCINTAQCRALWSSDCWVWRFVHQRRTNANSIGVQKHKTPITISINPELGHGNTASRSGPEPVERKKNNQIDHKSHLYCINTWKYCLPHQLANDAPDIMAHNKCQLSVCIILSNAMKEELFLNSVVYIFSIAHTSTHLLQEGDDLWPLSANGNSESHLHPSFCSYSLDF